MNRNRGDLGTLKGVFYKFRNSGVSRSPHCGHPGCRGFKLAVPITCPFTFAGQFPARREASYFSLLPGRGLYQMCWGVNNHRHGDSSAELSEGAVKVLVPFFTQKQDLGLRHMRHHHFCQGAVRVRMVRVSAIADVRGDESPPGQVVGRELAIACGAVVEELCFRPPEVGNFPNSSEPEKLSRIPEDLRKRGASGEVPSRQGVQVFLLPVFDDPHLGFPSPGGRK